jgi:hypothetical protein
VYELIAIALRFGVVVAVVVESSFVLVSGLLYSIWQTLSVMFEASLGQIEHPRILKYLI